MSESNMSPPGDERVRHLMMAEVDEEISGEGRRELELALEENPDLREELETFHRLKEVTDTMTPLKPPGGNLGHLLGRRLSPARTRHRLGPGLARNGHCRDVGTLERRQ